MDLTHAAAEQGCGKASDEKPLLRLLVFAAGG